MADDFDDFTKDLLNVAQEFEGGKQAKRFMKNQGRIMGKEIKQEFLDRGAGVGSGVTEQEIKKSFKGGKVFKNENGDLSCRGYSSHPLTHLLDKGFTHKPDGNFIPGHHFIDNARENFKDKYVDNVENFIDKMLDEYDL